MTLVTSPINGDVETKIVIFSNKKRLLALGLGHQPINKAFDLQSFLSAIYVEAKVSYNSWKCSTHD